MGRQCGPWNPGWQGWGLPARRVHFPTTEHTVLCILVWVLYSEAGLLKSRHAFRVGSGHPFTPLANALRPKRLPAWPLPPQ